ncbi:hypothetical protein [Lactococcus formosensis]|uniref:Uncharacterized protein n=1 Tax=Lactococcus formosensis TaxID=1281486 RepID=A0A9Q8Y0M4_9LACT|nr:hypothetical protein [Lactococcus formosensis]USJ19711.1 hypothetical protein LMK00_07690 [Lactococcus formosensis]
MKKITPHFLSVYRISLLTSSPSKNEEDKSKLLEKITDKKKELVTYQKQSLEEMKKELQAASNPDQKETLEKEIKVLEAKIAALEK